MKHPCILFLTILLWASLSCNKTSTIVKGKVINAQTGNPVEGATIEFYNYVPSLNGTYTESIPEYAISDGQGVFQYTVRSDAKYASIYSAFSNNHIRKRLDFEDFNIIMETTNEFTIPLIRYNTYLHLHIKNESGHNGSVHIAVNNPTLISEARTSWGRIFITQYPLELGEEKSYILPLVANEYTKIYWGDTNFISNQTEPTHKDSVLLMLNDTLNYPIIY